jgi:hypothetical protein
MPGSLRARTARRDLRPDRTGGTRLRAMLALGLSIWICVPAAADRIGDEGSANPRPEGSTVPPIDSAGAGDSLSSGGISGTDSSIGSSGVAGSGDSLGASDIADSVEAARAALSVTPNPSLAPLTVPARLGPFVPEAVAADAFGNIFALDRGAGRILRFEPGGTVGSFGISDQSAARLPLISLIAVPRGPDLYALDDAAGVLYRFDLEGRLRRATSLTDGSGGGLTPARTADFALGPAGELYLLDRFGGRLLLFDREGRFVTDLFAGLTGAARPRAPVRLAVAGDGALFILDKAGCRVRLFSREGVPLGEWPGLDPDEAAFEPPGLLALAGDRRLVLVSCGEGRIWLRNRAGRLLAEDRLSPPPHRAVSDLEVVGDTLLLLASPDGGEILRRRLPAADDVETANPR